MLRNVNITSGEVMGEFLDNVLEVVHAQEKKMKYLDGVGEDERTKAHHTIKLIERFYFIHGV